MIPADLGAELARAISAAVAAGDLPAAVGRPSPSGTWRSAPDSAGSYATSLPFELGRPAHQDPVAIAARLAIALRPLPWISSAEPTGGGYLTVTVTAAALAELAVRIATAGPGRAARGTALRGVARTAPPLPDLTAASGWRQAWAQQAAALTGRLAAAAGATVTERATPSKSGPELPSRPTPSTPPGPGSVAATISYAGADAVRYGLARTSPGGASGLPWGIGVSNALGDPFYAVSFAHADAASVLRWAADLGLPRGERGGEPGREPDAELGRLLGLPPERALLYRLSWLAERVAGAARRDRPDELPRYLEEVAGAWLDCRESCPALPFGGQAAPRDAAGTGARLWLADATRTVLAAGLGLVGVSPSDRQ